KAQSGSIHFKIYKQPGHFRKSFTARPTLVNMIGVPEVSASELRSSIHKIKEDMNSTHGRTNKPSNNDKMVLETLDLLSNISMDVGPLSMNVYPTDDPMVYKMIMSASLSNMSSTSEGEGVNFLQSTAEYV